MFALLVSWACCNFLSVLPYNLVSCFKLLSPQHYPVFGLPLEEQANRGKPNCRLQYRAKQTRGNLKSSTVCMGQDLSLSLCFLLTSAHPSLHVFALQHLTLAGGSLYSNAINGFHIGSALFIHYTVCCARVICGLWNAVISGSICLISRWFRVSFCCCRHGWRIRDAEWKIGKTKLNGKEKSNLL